MKKEEAMRRLKQIQEDIPGDEEDWHLEADKILMQLLISLGLKEVADEYDKIPKWYA